MSTHTPGPWVYRRGDEWSLSVVTHHGELPDGNPNAWTVASLNTRRDEADANARLIAAAPQLLEALRRYDTGCMAMDPEPNCQCVGCVTRAAIAKAEGTS